jgi:hypothetical protein
MPAWTARSAAALIALVCWAGLAIQFAATYANQSGALATLWILFRFFTVLTNLLVAVVMTRVSLGARVSPSVLGGTTLAILLVGVVYATLLRGLIELSGGAVLADIMLHTVSPFAAALWWLFFAPHGRLTWQAPVHWCVFPFLYFAYALVRGGIDGRYPYPFIDVGKIGWLQTGINAVVISLAFILAGYLLVWTDRRLLGRAGQEARGGPSKTAGTI